MMTFLIWDEWLSELGDALYQFMFLLFEASREAYDEMNRGFDAGDRRLFRDFYLE